MKIQMMESRLWRLLNIPFPDADLSNTFLTFGRTIWCSQEITDDLIVHEKVHIKQQKESYVYAVWWWIKYIFSSKFRFSQEEEAYVEHYKYLCAMNKDRNRQNTFRISIAESLSSPRYKNMISYSDAMSLLKKA